jgi:hypothetical protein
MHPRGNWRAQWRASMRGFFVLQSAKSVNFLLARGIFVLPATGGVVGVPRRLCTTNKIFFIGFQRGVQICSNNGYTKTFYSREKKVQRGTQWASSLYPFFFFLSENSYALTF